MEKPKGFLELANDILKRSTTHSLNTSESSGLKLFPDKPSGKSDFSTGCLECDGRGFKIVTGENYLESIVCKCVKDIEGCSGGWQVADNIRKRSRLAGASGIPNRYLKPLDGKIDPGLVKWFNQFIEGKELDSFLFLTGGTGTGKTHTACNLLISTLLMLEDKDVAYLPVHELIERRNDFLDCRYSKDKGERSYSKKNYDSVADMIRYRSIVVIDELGQEKLSPDERKVLFKLLDDRYSKKKPTILISNHSDNKELSLDGKILTQLVGKRIASRLSSALQVRFDGRDRRLQEGQKVVTDAEVEEFKMGGKILSLNDKTHHLMTWLNRNPAFETVSTRRRNSLTKKIDDSAVDMDRPEPSSYKDVWVGGDRLLIHGPVCDHEDKKLYALLVKELAKNHQEGIKGLMIKTSMRELARIAQIKPSGQNLDKIRRQLNRLTRMSMDFVNEKGNRWIGPLLNSVGFVNQRSREQVTIEFNRFMITFYKLHSYTTFNADVVHKLKGDASAFYLFYSSHSRREMSITIDKCKQLLGIDPAFDKKEARKRVKKAVDSLVAANVMEGEGTFIKSGKVYTGVFCFFPDIPHRPL